MYTDVAFKEKLRAFIRELRQVDAGVLFLTKKFHSVRDMFVSKGYKKLFLGGRAGGDRVIYSCIRKCSDKI